MATNLQTQFPATDKQVALIAKLAQEKAWESVLSGNEFERVFDASTGSGKFIGKREASACIDALFACPRRPAPAGEAKAQLEEGVYVMPDGCVVKVQANKAKTNLYAKRWVEIRGERLLDHDGETRVQGEWEYAPGVIRSIKPEMRMTLDEAKAFILRYGQCARCARRLKAAESVERGIGPVCVKYFSF